MNQKREIDPRELLYYVLKKWRAVIVFALALAVILGAGKLVSNLRGATAYEADAHAEQRAILSSELDDLQQVYDMQVKYNENSILMKVNTLDEHIGSFLIYVDPGYQIDPSATYQNPDTTAHLVKAYEAFLTSGELYAYVLEDTEHNDDITDERFIAEIIQVEANPDAASVSVKCVSDTEERAAEMLAAVKQAVLDKYPEIKATVGNHKCSIIMESVYTTIDRELEDAQLLNYKRESENKDKVDAKKAEISALGNPDEVPGKMSFGQALRNAVKRAVIAGVVGLVLGVAYYFVLGIVTRKMWCDASWSNCGIEVLGKITQKKDERKFAKVDRWFARITNFEAEENGIDGAEALAAANVLAMLKKKGVSSAAVVSTADKKLCADIVGSMNKSAEAFSFAGNVLSESEAVERLADVNDVVLLAESEKTTVDDVSAVVNRLDVLGKNLLGVIVIK